MESELKKADEMWRRATRLQASLGQVCRRLGATLAALLILGLFAQSTPAQSYLTSTGTPSFATPEPVELGSVDASNGNLHLSIPLGSYPQRGSSQPEPVTLEYDSNIWATYPSVNDFFVPQWMPTNGPAYFSQGGWHFSFLTYSGAMTLATVATQDCTMDQSWMDQNGTTHYFHLKTGGSVNNGCPLEDDAFATDSSGYHMFIWLFYLGLGYTQFSAIYAPDGTLVSSFNIDIADESGIISKDSNGNYLSSPGFGMLDTLDRQIAVGSGLSPGSDQVTVSTSQGTASYNSTWASITVNTNFQQPNIEESGKMQLQVMTSLTLPDAAQSTYTFTYDCDQTNSANPAGVCSSSGGRGGYYGLLTGITLPTGGTVSYSYTVFSDAYSNKSEWVTSRSSAGGNWFYEPKVLSKCNSNQVNCQQKTTVVSPTDQKVYTFQLNNGAWPTTIVQSDLSGNLLSTVTNNWNFSVSCPLISCQGVSNAASFVTLTSQTTEIPNSSGNLTKQTSYSYDQYGNKTAIKEWNYTSSGSFGGIPDRATYMSYLYYINENPANYPATNYTATSNINRPTSVQLCSSSGSGTACPSGGGFLVSQTLYTYDCYSGSDPISGRACTTLAGLTGIAQHDDVGFNSSNTMRGNPTSISRWVSGSTYLTTSYTYDTTGQVLTQTDPAGNITTYGYADNFYTDPGNDQNPSAYSPEDASGNKITTNAYVTSVTDAIGTQTIGYYWGSGKAAVTTDYNKQPTYSHYQDGLDRQTEEIDPIGWKLATYSSASRSDMYTSVADASPSTGCSSCQHTQTVLDSWGRTASQILVNNPIGPVEVDSSYDMDGRLYTQSHPYSGGADPNYVFETFGYDALDRQTSTTHPDGQAQQAAYGNITSLGGIPSQQGATATYGYGYPQVSKDESGHLGQQWLDGFGRIIEVDEPNSSGSLTSSPFVTNYVYDAGDRLTQVIQGTQTRIFAYDGLGRKISENTPEGGTVTYAYTASGGGLCSGDPSNVCQRTDARGVVSTYTYDHGNRLTGVAYTIPGGQNISPMPNGCITSNGTPANVCKYYDQGGAAAHAVGLLTEMDDPTGSENYSYDRGGRVTQVSKVVNGKTYNIGYQYDTGGDVTQITYPSGRVVQQAYNQVGQLCEIAPTASGCGDSNYYAGGFAYNAPGKLTNFTYGNGVAAAFYYSPDRMQLVYLAYTKGNSTYFNLQYSYCQNSLYAPSCPNGTTGNNGSVQCITDNVDSGRSAYYGYDPLQRMTTAQTCGSQAFAPWGMSESYDRFGNRWSQTATAGSVPQTNMSFSNSNQPTGYTFDPSGNMTVEPLAPPNVMTYDSENRMTAFQGFGGAANYSYDGNGMRVVKSVTGGATTVSIFSGSSVIAEYDNGAAPTAPSREYIQGATGLLAMISNGATTYYHQDHLSVRLTTDANGNKLSEQGSFPFGELWYQSGPDNKWFFTSYDRDSESGLDYALARYYDSRTGTFCSADPLAGSPGDPQSWNRYPYGRNDPIDITDPSGQNWFFSLMAGIMYALAPFTEGATLPAAHAFALEDGLDGLMHGQPPWGFNPAGGISAPSAVSWNGTPENIPNPGIAGALGLPTMADVGGPIYNVEDALSQQQINRRVDLTALNFSWRCLRAFKAVGKAMGIPFSIESFTSNLKSGPFDQEPGIWDPRAAAQTDQGSTGPNSTATIHLFHGFYSEDPTTQGFTLFHEETHRYFGIADYQYPGGTTTNFDTLFAPYGYRRQPGENSYAFTKWLKGGCR